MTYNADFEVVELPIVKIRKIESEFSLGDITNLDPFHNLARRITEHPADELERMLYDARVVTGPDGLRQTKLIRRKAADEISATRLDLPGEELRARLLNVIMGARPGRT